MATTTNLTSTYAGAVAGGYLQEAFLSNESLAHVTVRDNIPFKQVVRRLRDNATSFDPRTCDFSPQGTINLDERTLTLTPLSYQRNLCIDTYLQDWEALAAQNDNINDVREAVVVAGLGLIGQINEPMVWTGDSTNPGVEYDGFLTLMGSDITINNVLNTQALTATNIIAEIQRLIAVVPTSVKRSTEKPTIYLSHFAWEQYMYAQVGSGFATYLTNGPAVSPTFMGIYDIAICPGMPDNTMVMAQKSNLWFGTNKLADWNNLEAIDMTQWGEKNVRLRADFFAGVQYGFGNEIGLYEFGGNGSASI
jgi:hypothetical protein